MKWRENYELFDRNRALIETVFREKDPVARDRIVEKIIQVAEEGHGQVRSILLNPMFLRPDRSNSLLFCPGYERYGTITQVVERYCQTKWGCSIRDILINSKEKT